jgi:urease accessory protein
MTEHASLYKLLAWLSPGYPIGAYTYSHGLEYAVEEGFVTTADETREWIESIISQGSGYSDAVFLKTAYEAALQKDKELLVETCALAAGFSATKELFLETRAQGEACLDITTKAWPTETLDWLQTHWSGPYLYPIVIGVAAAGHAIPRDETIDGYLHAFAANLVSAATRLVPLGQTDGQKIIAKLEPCVAASGKRAAACMLDDVSNNAVMVDICSMNHEHQHTRLFRS